MEDQDIIKLYNARDERAIAESKNKYGSYCMTIAQNILSNREDAEECVNDTYLAAWETIPPEQPLSLSAYLGAITRRIAYNQFRHQRRKKRSSGEIDLALDELEMYLISANDPESDYHVKELSQGINRFLGTLSQRDRNILLWRYYFVYSIEEIAQNHGLRANYVRVILSRTLKQLKIYLEKENYL